ncbi:alpha-hydroxy acid oxidase [Variovorax sp. J22R24]|uniref:alpha-hydroxy acid oxidase n=1 Tax=Variovorax gracilis TaxID=3053502 RepID=UPI002575387C|nr:alpha-hydroxy acid oxidase [Variovorax sp. J22R24]MDM0108532.1 alpha-hydroxy acid oxidase [Variovorax sp. J22R24]
MTIAASLAHAASIEDLRLIASRKLPRMVFDYIDGASGSEATARRNRAGFDRFLLRPEILVDLSKRDPGTTLFGERVALPMVIGPTGMNGAYWAQGDLCLARAARQENIPFVMSTAATVGLDPLVQAAGPMRWFQLYMLRDRGLAQALLDRIDHAGFKVLQLTGDTAVAGRRNRDIRNGFTLPFRWSPRKLADTARRPGWAVQMLRHGSPTLQLFAEIVGNVPQGATISEVMQRQINDGFTWRDLDWLRERWPGKLVLKGVASAEHARLALAAGLEGVVVSNHGGRQLDGASSTIEQLPSVVDAAAGRLTILIDSGFRHGADIAKAIALGADAVQLGRPTLFGLAAGGEAGARHALRILAAEFDCEMALSGATRVQDLRGRVQGRERLPTDGFEL